MATIDSSTKESEKQCLLCCQEIDIFALGKCDHPVCYRCSTKMRVYCDQKYCALCREDLDKVVFVKKLQDFASVPYQRFPCDQNHGIYFKDERVFAQYKRLLLPQCIHCPEPKVFSTFEELERHMRKQHKRFCCRLCSKHLKMFSYERKWYTQKQLACHQTHGEPNDTSHRGHPLCKFCYVRYLDNDELFKHLRKDHFFCHFCDADGSQEYYCDYQKLSEHFRQSHYLCEEGQCATEKFTHAFRTEIDFKGHKAAVHSKNRQVNLEFNLPPRPHRRNDRQAARKGSSAVSGQRGAMKDKRASKVEERAERAYPGEQPSVSDPVNPTANMPPLKTMASRNPEDEFIGLGATVASPTPQDTHAHLQEEFPSLPVTSVSTRRRPVYLESVSTRRLPAYFAPPKKTTFFQEEDFPALASMTHTPATTKPAPICPGLELLSSTSMPSSERKNKIGESGKASIKRSNSKSDDESGGLIRQEFRAAPTLSDIASLLNGKGSGDMTESSPSPVLVLGSTVPESSSSSSPSLTSGGYRIPEDFEQRNLDLTLSIKKYLLNNESKFNQFKNYSAQFRQNVISATQYHHSCMDLLGENLSCIFNELLALLPDINKQQELRTAHVDSRVLENQTEGSKRKNKKKNKNKKNSCQTPPTISSAANECDYQTCPTCRQVLAPKDLISHKSLHTMESKELHSFLSISRLIC
ncbi:LOW QUALITY PROTEIN: E3 ubiquitin-protein ligase ZNF598-like [Boleophthalmus pectinirostris]|uniref:LOW QUALITY PROTEIN: E3 ubiquitin-protein ligase ZNF598-like n=1 Tax=Boleophthalmus pectinirostris TaxID=150288 RepID=UPI00242AC2D3|nr:LOW QUALITY PROTEIN: E3 ubiquitin-protein ligase ZNF598-like [Boleophthalmus pectinirostris]